MTRFPDWLRGVLVASALGAGALALPASGFGQAPAAPPVDAAQQQFAFAQRLFQHGDDKLAAEAFDDFLGKFPRDERRGDALYFRAVLAQRAGDNAGATKLLAQVTGTRLVPSYAPLLLQGQIASAQGQYDQAIATLEKIPTDKLDPAAKASVAYLRGAAYQGAGNALAASKAFEQAAAADSPLKARALLEMGRSQSQQSDQAAAALDTFAKVVALKDAESAPEAARLAGDLAYKLGQYPKAIESYRTVIAGYQSSPHFGPALVGVLWSQFSAKQYAELIQTLNQYRQALPAENRGVAFYLAGSAFQELGQHEQAATLLAAVPPGAAGGNLQEKALFKLATSQFEQGKYDLMSQAIDKLRGGYPNSPLLADADFLLAAADARKDPAKGAARLNDIVKAGPRHPYYAQALAQRAKLYLAANQLEPAAADYQRVFDLAKAGGAGAPSDAIAADAALRLADVSTRMGKPDPAVAASDWLLGRSPAAPVEQEALFRKGLALVKAGKLGPAADALTQLLTKHPQSPFAAEARYYRGALLVTQNKPDDALADLQAAASAKELPEDLKIKALRLASKFLRERNDPRAADVTAQLQRLAGAQRLSPDEALWLARGSLAANQPKEALSYLTPLLDAKANVPAQARADAMLAAARSYRALNDNKHAIDLYRQIEAQGEGAEFQARLELAKTLRDAGSTEEALTYYEGLVSAPTSSIAAEAIFDSAQINHDLARQKKTAGQDAAVAQLLTDSEKLFKRLVLLYSFPQLSPLPELGYIELAEVQREAGRTADADATLKELAERFPNTDYASYATAMRSSKRTDAVYLLKKLREKGQLDPRLATRVSAQIKTLEAAS